MAKKSTKTSVRANESSDRTLGILVHLLTFISSIIAPLIVLLVAQDSFSKNNAREALNWQISLLLYLISGAILTVVFIFVFPLLLIVFIPLLIFLVIADIVLVIIAAVKASEGVVYSYPGAIRFIRQK